ncbi:hypothetical protein [Cupriavidus pinatubonensis]|uniref:hypothetical protein n=1 Tax=Cupriavidus pinatubonensis TaxID=248026 RepID=UPI0011277A19
MRCSRTASGAALSRSALAAGRALRLPSNLSEQTRPYEDTCAGRGRHGRLLWRAPDRGRRGRHVPCARGTCPGAGGTRAGRAQRAW